MRDDELMRQAIAGAIRDGLAQTPESRRDRFAAAALTGLLAGSADHDCHDIKVFARAALQYGDALIAALDKPAHAQLASPEALRRLAEIVEAVKDEVDITDGGGPNLAAKVLTIARGEDRP